MFGHKLFRAVRASGLATSLQCSAQRRHLSIHEYLSMDLLEKYGVNIPKGAVAKSPEEAFQVAKSLNVEDLVVKAQVLAGGRGKGYFDSGLQGGVKVVYSPEEVKELAKGMIGSKLITKQTGSAGRICNSVYVVERKWIRKEYYFAITMDRTVQGPVIIASSQGGMDIEQVAHENPSAIVTLPIDINKGLVQADAEKVAVQLGFRGKGITQAADIFQNLYKLFIEKDANLVEINPLAELANGDGIFHQIKLALEINVIACMDAKIGFDDNADFRQKDIFELRDVTQEDQREVAAAEYHLNYIGLSGSIG
ncbi:hypothetical protein HK096_000579, partial [Nowakowskiella sp. JEL0078]